MDKAKWFKWEGYLTLMWMWANGQVKVVLCLEQCEILVRHAHEELGHLGSNRHIVHSKHNTSCERCSCKFNNLFLGVWCVTEFRHPSMHLHFTYNPYQLWGLGTNGVWILSTH